MMWWWLFLIVCTVFFGLAVRKKNNTGIAVWAILGVLVFFVAGIGSLLQTYPPGATATTADTDATATPRGPGFNHKAVANERTASKLGGGFDADQRDLYHRGLEHIYNIHGHIGSYTIGAVIDMEYHRDQERAAEANQKAQAAERRAEAARQAAQQAAAERQREEEAHLYHGNPDCLVLDNRTLTTESGDYTWYIDGKVTNECDHDMGYVQVEFNFFDNSGNQVSSGMVNVNNLAAGHTWAFHKAVYESDASGGHWQVSGLSGF